MAGVACARHCKRSNIRIHAPAFIQPIDDRLALDKLCMHISPVRDDLVMGQIWPTSAEYVYL
jgi:hypothetical protein